MTFSTRKKTMLFASILALTSLTSTGSALSETRWDIIQTYLF